MSINTISAGQKDWVTVLNNNFTELGKQSERADLVISNGWSQINNEECYVKRIPLPSGDVLKIMQLNIQNASVQNNANFGSIVTVPDDFGSAYARPVGNTVSINTEGHFQGYFEWTFANFNNLGGSYVPLNGESGTFNIQLRATLLYF